MRVAVVTGASKGIGRRIAAELAERGMGVIAASRDTSDPVVGAEPFELDVTRDDQVRALALHAPELDVLVNNAGISMRGFDANVARKTLDVNFFGTLRVTEALLPAIRRGGRVVMVSSGLGELSCVSAELRRRFLDPKLSRDDLVGLMESFVRDVAAGVHSKNGWPSSAYNVSKVGMNALTRILARDLAADPRKILVNSANPGWVRTAMGGAGAPRSVEHGARTPVWLATLPDGGPTGGFFYDEHPQDW
jgi:NAD(P)-dependent dehydrogenase (short-subunit alcohol dehydrogenase family)